MNFVQHPVPYETVDIAQSTRYVLRLQADWPTRPVDWRRRLCQYILDTGHKAGIKLDAITRKAYKFFKEIHKVLTSNLGSVSLLFNKLYRKYPEYAKVWQIAEDPDSEHTKVELQCAILGRIPEDEILAQFCLTSLELQLFCALYYDVLDRLDNVRYICDYAIFFDTEKYNFLDEANRNRFLSYMLGPDIVRLLSNRLSVYNQNDPKDFKTILRESIQNIRLIKTWAYANTEFDHNVYAKVLAGFEELASVPGVISHNQRQIMDELAQVFKFQSALREGRQITEEEKRAQQIFDRTQ